jgi:hypothetical protein
MEDFLVRSWRELLGLFDGPTAFRFILQPMVATILAVRAGMRGPRDGRPTYSWSFAGHRMEYSLDDWKNLAKVFAWAVTIDFVCEIIEFHSIYPIQSLSVATMLAVVPYLFLRGPMSRIMRQHY